MIEYRFGPVRVDGNRRVFRLWAPSADTVDLVLPDGGPGNGPDAAATVAMHPAGDAPGWYQSPPTPAPAGTRYGFRIDGDLVVPDPASRMQAEDVHGFSVVVDRATPGHPAPPSRPWEDSVIYEAHVGTCASDGTAPGTFRSLIDRLGYLASLGITVLELLPVADFPGSRNWGYDGVLPFAPDRSYGTPDDLRALVDAAHRRGIAVWMDVVYNHFGPDGNYLHVYASRFFSDAITTPWGAGIDFSVPEVRRFFVENALYWVHEFGIDGLRLDAVHAIHDEGHPHILTELADAVRESLPVHRRVHLVLENDANQARFLRPPAAYHGQWNDDLHHVLHVLLTGEEHGYYRDFARDTDTRLVRALTEGFVFQGEPSLAHNGSPRGEPSGDLAPTRFVAFLQNHDQIGNRAFGDRIASLADPEALTAATALLLLIPQIPLLFMGQEWDSTTPFQFFCDFPDELGTAVRDGRRREFGLDDLPDPGDPDTFRRSCLEPPGQVGTVRELLRLRHAHLRPLLSAMEPGVGDGGGDEAVSVRYRSRGGWWCIDCNLSPRDRPAPREPRFDVVAGWTPPPSAKVASVFQTDAGAAGTMPPWSLRVWKERDA